MSTATISRPTTSIDSKFVKNSAWSIVGVTANVLVGLVLSPYMIRLLGPERFGIWALVFTVLDYFWIFDLGFTPAISNLVARAVAKNDSRRINEVINTASFYFLLIAICIWSLTFLFGPKLVGAFKVPPAHMHEFTVLVLMTGVSWGICVVLQMYVAALDAFQRFDLTNRVTMCVVIARSMGYIAVLLAGGGLIHMGAVFVGVQIVGSLMHMRNFRRVFTDLKYARRFVGVTTMKEILHYGLPAFTANASTLVLAQSSPIIIGHFLQTAFVGFFALPSKLAQNISDAVSRLSLVTRSRVAELDELEDRGSVADLVVHLNRYCYSLYMPLLIFVLLFGRPLLHRWLGAEFAGQSGPLLPILIGANALVLGGQFNSAAALFGLGKHRPYAKFLIWEAGLLLASLVVVVPRFGITGAAWTVAALMVIFRGVLTPALLCSSLRIPFLSYMHSIYLRPTLTALTVYAAASFFPEFGLHGDSWKQLFVAGFSISLMFAGIATFTCVASIHRCAALAAVRRLIHRRAFSPIH